MVVKYDGKPKPTISQVMEDIFKEKRPKTAEEDLRGFNRMYDELDGPTETPMPTLSKTK